MKKIYILVLLLLMGFINLISQDSKGTDFWVTFPPNYHNNKYDINPELKYGDSLYLFIIAEVPTSGSIVYYDSTGNEYNHSFSITNPNDIYTFKVSYFDFELVGFNDSGENFKRNQCEKIAKQSFHIISDNEITVYGHSQAITTGDAFLAFPTDILGNDYLIMSYYSDLEADYYSRTPSQFAVVATEDSTLITIEPKYQTYANGNNIQEITMNKGEVYLVQAKISGDSIYPDLTGSSVHSSKPIAVFSGHQRASVPVKVGNLYPSRDFLISEIPPVRTWGKNYFLTPFVTPNNANDIGTDIYRILAACDSTNVYINGQNIAILNKAEFYEDSLTTSAYITANSPILVAEFKKSSKSNDAIDNLSDPFFVVIPPYEQYLNTYKFINIQTNQFSRETNTFEKVYSEQYINIVAQTTVLNPIMLDGTPIPDNMFTKITNTDYYYANILVSEGEHFINSNIEFGIIVYGYGLADSYGYIAGQSFKINSSFVSDSINQGSEVMLNNTNYCYPNPLILSDASEVFFPIPDDITLYSKEWIDLIIYNTEMTEVFSKELNIDFDLIELSNGKHVVKWNCVSSNISSGVYIYKIVCKDKISIGKFIIIKH